MNFARRVFQFAALYGIVGLVPQYFLESRVAVDFPPAITHPEHYYFFIGVALAWQFLFLVIARDVVRFKPVMPFAALEKISVGAAALVLFSGGRVAWPVLAIGVGDLLWAAAFLLAWRRTPDA